MIAISGCRQRALRHAVKAIGEGNDIAAACCLPGDLHRGLDRIGAGGAGEHQLVIHVSRLQDHPLKGLKEIRLGIGVHIQTMGDPVSLKMRDQRLFHIGIVMAVVQR